MLDGLRVGKAPSEERGAGSLDRRSVHDSTRPRALAALTSHHPSCVSSFVTVLLSSLQETPFFHSPPAAYPYLVLSKRFPEPPSPTTALAMSPTAGPPAPSPTSSHHRHLSTADTQMCPTNAPSSGTGQAPSNIAGEANSIGGRPSTPSATDAVGATNTGGAGNAGKTNNASEVNSSGEVRTACGAKRNDLTNGTAEDSPIELVVFGFPCTHKDADGDWTDLATVRGVLQSIEPIMMENAINVRRLQVEISDPPGKQRTIRIRWHEAMWMKDTDLVAGMEAVMSELRKRGLEVYWANAKKTDTRTSVTFSRQLKNIPAPVGDATYPPLAEPDPTAWMVRQSPTIHTDIASYSTRTCTDEANVRTETVHVLFHHPSSVDLLEALFKDGGADRLRASDGITGLQRAQTQIITTFPTTIASPCRLGYDAHDVDDLLEELDCWVSRYNDGHATSERLLDVGGAKGRMVYDAHFVVVPSSVGLAEYLASQRPRCGHPYELLYKLNGRGLVPAAQATAEAEERVAELMTTELRAAQLEAAVAQRQAASAQTAAAQAQKAAADADRGETVLRIEQLHDSTAIIGQLQMVLEGQRIALGYLKRGHEFDSDSEGLPRKRARTRESPASKTRSSTYDAEGGTASEKSYGDESHAGPDWRGRDSGSYDLRNLPVEIREEEKCGLAEERREQGSLEPREDCWDPSDEEFWKGVSETEDCDGLYGYW